MASVLGIDADVVLTESVLNRILEVVDSMLLDDKDVGITLSGTTESDDMGVLVRIKGIGGPDTVAICVASQEGGVEPSDSDLIVFKKNLPEGILMKVDVFAHQFSFYKVGDTVEDARVLFQE